MLFANIVSHSVGGLFNLRPLSFTVQKAFSLMWSYVSFRFCLLCLRRQIKNIT